VIELIFKRFYLQTDFLLRDEECNQLQRVLDECKTSLIELAGKYQDLLNEISELQTDLTENRTKYEESVSQMDVEKKRYEALVEESADIERTLNAKIESLIAEKDFTSKRLEGILSKIEKNNIVLNNEINSQEKHRADEPEETAMVIKQEKQNGFHDERLIDCDFNVADGEMREQRDQAHSDEYNRQELELQKIINENLLKEIERLKSRNKSF